LLLHRGTRGFRSWLPGSSGSLLERGVISIPLPAPLESLLATWGVSLGLQAGFPAHLRRGQRAGQLPSWLSGSFVVSDVLFATTAFLSLASPLFHHSRHLVSACADIVRIANPRGHATSCHGPPASAFVPTV